MCPPRQTIHSILRNAAVLGTALALIMGLATPVKASQVDVANATVTCSTYSLSVSASGLVPGNSYAISYTIDVSPASSGFPISGSIPFTASSNGTFSDTVTGSFPTPLTGNYTFSGTATLVNYNTIDISFSPTSVACGAPPPPPCSAESTNSSNFNGTKIGASSYIWFNANFTASGIPKTGATITLSGSTISFTAGTTQYNLTVPNAQITFSSSATCSSTTFDTMSNTWVTTVPISGDDEIFLTGLTWPVPSSGLPGGINPVNWQGSFGTNGTPNVTINWKWGAAVYTTFTSNYNALAAKPGHQTACGMSNGDHAGTPEGVNSNNVAWKQFVIGGAGGGGGSNWTGSWSGTQGVTPICGQSIFTNQTPAAYFSDGPYELGMKFQSTVPGSIIAIRYWFCSSDTAPSHSGHIWDSHGNLLATVAFPTATATGWQQALLPTLLSIAANTTYVVSVNEGDCYGATDGGLSSQISNADLHSVADGNNGVYGSVGSFPTASFDNANYFRDVVFVPGQ
jgi:hypothetical protein